MKWISIFNQRKRGEPEVWLAPHGVGDEHSVSQARFVEISRLNDQVHSLEFQRRMVRCFKNAFAECVLSAENLSPLGIETIELMSRLEHRLRFHALEFLLHAETEQTCSLDLVPRVWNWNREDVALSPRSNLEGLLELGDDFRLQRGVERIVAFSLESSERLISQADQEWPFVRTPEPILRFGISSTTHEAQQKLLAIHEREELRLWVVWQNNVCAFSEGRSMRTSPVAELEFCLPGFLRNTSHLEEFHLLLPLLGVELKGDWEKQFRPTHRTKHVIARTARVGFVTETAKTNTARRTVIIAVLPSCFCPTIRTIARRNNNQLFFLHRFPLSQGAILPRFSNRRAYRTSCPVSQIIIANINPGVKYRGNKQKQNPSQSSVSKIQINFPYLFLKCTCTLIPEARAGREEKGVWGK